MQFHERREGLFQREADAFFAQITHAVMRDFGIHDALAHDLDFQVLKEKVARIAGSAFTEVFKPARVARIVKVLARNPGRGAMFFQRTVDQGQQHTPFGVRVKKLGRNGRRNRRHKTSCELHAIPTAFA
jgi:hypothetical protein